MMTWETFRAWRKVAIPVVLLAATWLINANPEGSVLWRTGIASIAFLGVAYVVEELVWMSRRKGRPCPHCGVAQTMKSFRVRSTCTACSQAL